MGVLYHLRYPLLGLDIAARKVGRRMIFQTLTMPGEEVAEPPADIAFDARQPMFEPGSPKMAFIEHRLANDPTNWWAPNHAAVEAMLRRPAAGAEPRHESTSASPHRRGARLIETIAIRRKPGDAWPTTSTTTSARRNRNKEDEKGQEPQKSYETILEQEIAAGLTELERPAKALLLSGLSAGLDVSLGLLLMAVVRTLTDGVLSKPVSEILVAMMYSSGFLFVVLGRSELFTEHTTLAVLPVLDGRASLRQLGRLWGLIYIANQVGAAAFAAFLVFLGPRLGIIEPRVFGEIASGLVEHPGLGDPAQRRARRLADGPALLAGGGEPRHHRPDLHRRCW